MYNQDEIFEVLGEIEKAVQQGDYHSFCECLDKGYFLMLDSYFKISAKRGELEKVLEQLKTLDLPKEKKDVAIELVMKPLIVFRESCIEIRNSLKYIQEMQQKGGLTNAPE